MSDKENGFSDYCEKCKHSGNAEPWNPCDICLLDNLRTSDEHPYFFKEKREEIMED